MSFQCWKMFFEKIDNLFGTTSNNFRSNFLAFQVQIYFLFVIIHEMQLLNFQGLFAISFEEINKEDNLSTLTNDFYYFRKHTEEKKSKK